MFLPLQHETSNGRRPYVVSCIILLNVIVFAWTLFLPQELWMLWAKRPHDLLHMNLATWEGWRTASTLITSTYLHADILHLAGNMVFLWAFGRKLEEELGHVRFFLFYVLAGLVASWVFVMVHPGPSYTLIGASGGISGVMGGFLLKYPFERIRTLFSLVVYYRIIAMPAFVYLFYWLGLNVLGHWASTNLGHPMGGVAWSSHLGGFLGGVLCLGMFKGFRPEQSWNSLGVRISYVSFAKLLGFLVLLTALGLYTDIAHYLRMKEFWTPNASFSWGKEIFIRGTYIFCWTAPWLLGLYWLRRRAKRMQRVLEHNSCMMCDSYNLQETDDTCYICKDCGFDSAQHNTWQQREEFQLFQEAKLVGNWFERAQLGLNDSATFSMVGLVDNEQYKEALSDFYDGVDGLKDVLQRYSRCIRQCFSTKQAQEESLLTEETLTDWLSEQPCNEMESLAQKQKIADRAQQFIQTLKAELQQKLVQPVLTSTYQEPSLS